MSNFNSPIASFTETATLSQRHPRNPALPAEPPKKRVVVTGGSGKLGRWVVREMVEAGWQVINFDVIPPAASEHKISSTYVKVEVSNYGQVISALAEVDDKYRGVDAIIHLAAIPSPGQAPNHFTFSTNFLATYNVLEACRVLRIKNIALASSETLIGIPLYPHAPEKFPITEDVARPESSYSLSKWLGEKMSEQFTRWDPELKIINIRLSNVISPERYAEFPLWQDDPWKRAWNAFCYIDARDCAQSFRLAIESSMKGCHVYNIANADSCFARPTSELVHLVFHGVQYVPDTNNPREALISIKKAREELGFEPKYDWQTEVKKLRDHIVKTEH